MPSKRTLCVALHVTSVAVGSIAVGACASRAESDESSALAPSSPSGAGSNASPSEPPSPALSSSAEPTSQPAPSTSVPPVNSTVPAPGGGSSTLPAPAPEPGPTTVEPGPVPVNPEPSTVPSGAAGAAEPTAPTASPGPVNSAGAGGSEQSSSPAPTTPPTDPEPPPWNGAIATMIDDTLLQSEYQAWKSKFVQTCDNGSAVVVKDGAAVSEGIAYGMLLSANLGDKELFDRLWQFYTDHLDENGLMNWSVALCEAPGNNMSHAASDAEMDALLALLQADRAFGGDYAEAARVLAAAVVEHEVERCDELWVLKPGDVWGGCSDMTGQTRINPSYFAPGYYRVFARQFPDQAEIWNGLLEGSYQLLDPMQARMDGLFPDWAGADGSDWYGAGYGYDACRVPWRIAVDYAWSADPRAASLLEGVAGWVQQNGGIPVGSMPNNSAFQGAFALASIDAPNEFDAKVDQWLTAGGDDGPYFQATLRLLYLLVAGGRFPAPGRG